MSLVPQAVQQHDDINEAFFISYEINKIPGLRAESKDAQIYVYLKSDVLEDICPIIYEVNGGNIYGRTVRFWTRSAFFLHLIDPKISFKCHTINTFKQHRLFLGHTAHIINGVVTDKLFFAYDIVVSIFESTKWHNTCYLQIHEQKHIVDTMITPEKVDQFLYHWSRFVARAKKQLS